MGKHCVMGKDCVMRKDCVRRHGPRSFSGPSGVARCNRQSVRAVSHR